ncbi:MAG TPA: DUF4235 domain-containing protein [Nocardioides sp.]|uniref:DUF4235 domain-containing protein n=1 Tax=uncultured Nocardioides sp. TaxID=198441 RepID=UPI000EDA8617|nr:DUF4235 domain-containing protein [uncultured Nocardioides sp.]HCB05681.1 hypothetical protein [Nocardioides sp.]HRD61343.1 DUF4235 domain-containing protein [Nocardioides sp.]HRI98569.1 DUF4235 domain-containing protein [Nocardioides sp.]
MDSDSSRVWALFSLVAGLGAAALTRKLLDQSWKAAAGKNPPENPADPDVSFGEAVLWASITGAAVALARMLAQRRAANYYKRSTGQLPPGLRSGDTR